MILSLENNLIFFKPLKCAGSSLEYALLEKCGPEDLCTGYFEDEGAFEYPALNNTLIENKEEKKRFHTHTWPGLFFERTAVPSFWKNFTAVTVVRNPWDTVVSWYWWNMRKLPDNHPMYISKNDAPDKAQKRFEDFLNFQADHDSIRHEVSKVNCKPLDFIASTNEHFIDDKIDIYLMFENIQDDYNSLCKKLEIESSVLPRLKSTQRAISRHYSFYYNDSTRQQVFNKFPKTIRKFDYKFMGR
tara:strand:+ start:16776 stop:17507 length:732 start_codon:yes stop_codon:yes gene_type:complete